MDYQDIKDLQQPLTGLRNVFIRLTEEHRPALWKYCHRLTGNALDAEDLVQDTLLRAFAKLAYLGQALNPRAYLFRMATNCWLNQNEKKTLPIATSVLSDQIEDAAIEEQDISEAMEWLVRFLPPKQRVAFLLSTSFDFSHKAIADLMGTSEGTVKSYLYRARKTLAAEGKRNHENDKPTVTGLAAPNELVKKYLSAFNNFDVDSLLSLMDENATSTITGDWMEMGKEEIKNNSLHYWALDTVEKWAEFGYLDGVPVIYGFRKNEAGENSLREIIRLQHDDKSIYAVDWHFFTRDLVQYAAAKLGLPCIVEGYQYEAAALPATEGE